MKYIFRFLLFLWLISGKIVVAFLTGVIANIAHAVWHAKLKPYYSFSEICDAAFGSITMFDSSPYCRKIYKNAFAYLINEYTIESDL